jgi:hypothetical protein
MHQVPLYKFQHTDTSFIESLGITPRCWPTSMILPNASTSCPPLATTSPPKPLFSRFSFSECWLPSLSTLPLLRTGSKGSPVRQSEVYVFTPCYSGLLLPYNILTEAVPQSVPPLYDALKRIWMWIDTEPTLRPPVNGRLDEEVGKRLPWWEHLVQRVQENEMEILCLT